MRPFKYALFDFDGTLADSQWYWQTMIPRVLKSRGYDVKGEDFARCMNLTVPDRWEYCKKKFNLTESDRPEISEIRRWVDSYYRTELTWKPGVAEYLKALKARGISMAVFSATGEEMVRNGLRHLGGEHYFEHVFSCNSIGASKSDPVSYQACLDALGLAAEDVIMFEDAPYSMKTAKSLGMQVCAVYDSCMLPCLDEIIECCDAYVMKMSDLLEG